MPSTQIPMSHNVVFASADFQDEDIHFVKLTPRQFVDAQSVLWASYRNDPLYRYIFDDSDPAFDQRVRATIREGLNLHLRNNLPGYGVRYKNRLVGVAFVRSPTNVTGFDLNKEYRWHLGMYLTAGFAATRRFLRYRDEVQARLPSTQYSLAMMAIHPDFQQTGLGMKLLNHLHQKTAACSKATGVCIDASLFPAERLERLQNYQCLGSFQLGGHTRKILYRDFAHDVEQPS